MSAALTAIRALYPRLTMADQLELICDIIQRGHKDLDGSDAWVDALMPVDAAFVEAWAALSGCAEREMAA